MPTKPYTDYLYEELRDPDYATAYLSECFELGMDEFLITLRDVVEARGGIRALADESDLNRESLYKLLSERGNPRLSSLAAILNALDLKMVFMTKTAKDKEAA